ncbi:NAD(P)-binding domain-containing protein [Nocardia sp. NPDC051929]
MRKLLSSIARTIDVDQARGLHTVAEYRSVRFLDAPVSGGVNGAMAGR